MTTKTTTTPIDPRERSIALAEVRGWTARAWAAKFVSERVDSHTGALLNVMYSVTSASSDTDYRLTYDAAADDAVCVCRSAQFDHACWHRGLAIIKGRRLAARLSPAGSAAEERHAAQDRIDEENARCLGF